MKIIDFEKKGNVVRFYLGDDNCNDYHGDDWNDTPYEHNAGTVYFEYIKGYTDMSFPFDDLVLEPRDGTCNSEYSKDDMKDLIVPCIIVIPAESADWNDSFQHYLGVKDKKVFYFGDPMIADYEGLPPHFND